MSLKTREIPTELHLTNSRLPHRPRFLRELEGRSEEVGFIQAMHEALRRDNVNVSIDGDFDRLKEHDGGILFFGDHKHQWEFIALIDMLAQMGRGAMINIAKFYVQRQVHQALGVAASKLILPVYPRILARDRGEFFNSELINRTVYRRFLKTKEESAAVNERVLQASAEFLEDDGAVNIFPCGSVVDARTHPWRAGIGSILRHLSEEKREDVLLAPYALGDLSRARFLGSLAMRGQGVWGRPQSMNVQIGLLHTAGELIGSLPPSDRNDPNAITMRLRQQFLDHFDSAQSS